MDDVTSIIAITICKVIQKRIAEMSFWRQIDVNKRGENVCLVTKIHFS